MLKFTNIEGKTVAIPRESVQVVEDMSGSPVDQFPTAKCAVCYDFGHGPGFALLPDSFDNVIMDIASPDQYSIFEMVDGGKLLVDRKQIIALEEVDDVTAMHLRPTARGVFVYRVRQTVDEIYDIINPKIANTNEEGAVNNEQIEIAGPSDDGRGGGGNKGKSRSVLPRQKGKGRR